MRHPCGTALALLSAIVLAACAADDEEDTGDSADELTVPQQQSRCDEIKANAAPKGVTNPLVYAGIAFHESGLAQCYSEASWHCAGPYSSYCGGSVLAGSADGACSLQQGGIGMFQLDSGTWNDTLAAHGSGILSAAGNIDKGVDFIVYKVEVCPNTPSFGSTAEAIAWINSATPGTAEYETFLDAMTRCYNGCHPSWSCWSSTRAAYASAVQYLLDTFGWEYWYGGGGGVSPPSSAPTGLSPDGWVTMSGASVTLDWHPVAGATDYDVTALYWTGSAWASYYTWNTGSDYFTFWPAYNNRYYAWNVTPRNSAGAGPVSAWAYFYYANGPTPPPAPSSVSNWDAGSGRIGVSYGAVSGATYYGYQITRWNGGGAYTWASGTTSSTSFTTGSVPASDWYNIDIQACNSAGCSGWVDGNPYWLWVTLSSPPAAPSSVSNWDAGYLTLGASYPAVSGATYYGYSITRWNGGSAYTWASGTTTYTGWTIGTVPAADWYNVDIQACNSSGCSSWVDGNPYWLWVN